MSAKVVTKFFINNAKSEKKSVVESVERKHNTSMVVRNEKSADFNLLKASVFDVILILFQTLYLTHSHTQVYDSQLFFPL